MAFFIGRDREARRSYGFDEVALVPGRVTINPKDVDISSTIGGLKLDIPIIASAMDGVVDAKFAVEMGKIGGLAVLNTEGVQVRYEDAGKVIEELVKADPNDATKLIQQIYSEEIKEELITKRIKEIKQHGVKASVSVLPKKAEEYGDIAVKAGVDILFVQSTVTTAMHHSSEYKMVDFKSVCSKLKLPVVIGNTVGYDAALDLMESGCAGILVGIGPGAACTTRGVLGMGVPQVTATVDCAAARDYYFKKTGKYCSIITDGGMNVSGDICKAIACGSDAVMIGSALARAIEAPGKGYHWGMATPDRNLPRGTRIHVGTTVNLKNIIVGPAIVDDGSQNIAGALRISMGSLGAKNIKEMQLVEIIIAPDIKSEGKVYQKAQKLGMGK